MKSTNKTILTITFLGTTCTFSNTTYSLAVNQTWTCLLGTVLYVEHEWRVSASGCRIVDASAVSAVNLQWTYILPQSMWRNTLHITEIVTTCDVASRLSALFCSGLCVRRLEGLGQTRLWWLNYRTVAPYQQPVGPDNICRRPPDHSITTLSQSSSTRLYASIARTRSLLLSLYLSLILTLDSH